MRIKTTKIKVNPAKVSRIVKNTFGSVADFCESFGSDGIDITTFYRWNRTGWPEHELWALCYFTGVRNHMEFCV